MGKRGPRMAPVVLSDEEEATLRRWADRRSTAQALARRSRIVLALCYGLVQHRRGGTGHLADAIIAQLGVDGNDL